ncbi:uncharacterized protein LOC142396606 [Odontesthes bonariensis]|uniref:uncharacterized protein LOC142396606 n=1 Tax=Odontesthes bonariensis TaxID=219752 RepID=UPI003F5863E6
MDYRCFYVYCIFTSCLVAGQTPKYALVGQRIMFNADITTPPDEILWKHDGNKVVEFDGNQEQLFGSYTNRVVLNWHSADLEIDQLRFEDSGTYELEVFTKTVLDRSSYKLEVIDKVPEPTITCEMKKGSSSDESGNQATLTCSAELGQSPSLTKFQWSSNGNVQSGRNLTISLGDEHDNEVYTCTVSNPLTKESAVFTAKECYSDKDSSTALIVCILIPILLVGLAILIFILWRKGHFSKKTEEDLEKQADEIKGNHGFNGDEGRPLLDRAPTMPSHQPLHFVPRNNDPVALEQDTEEGQDMTPQKGFVKNRVRNIEETTQHIPAGQDKTPQKGFVKNRVRNIEETPQHIPAGSQKNEDNDRKTSSSSLVAEEPAPVLDRSQDLYEEEKQEANETLAEESDDQRSQKNEDNDRKTSSSSLVAEEPAPVLDRSQDLYEEEKQEANETLAEESDDQKSDQAEFASEISVSPPASRPFLHSTENSPNMAPHNETVEHKDVASSGPVTKEQSEESHHRSDSSSSVEKNEAGTEVKESLSTAPEEGNADVASSGPVTKEHTEESQRRSDSSSSVEKNEAGTEVKESPSTAPEEEDADVASSNQVAEEHTEESQRRSDSSSSVEKNEASTEVKESLSTTSEEGNADVASSGLVTKEHTEESQRQSDSPSSVEKNEAGTEVKESPSTAPEAGNAEETAHKQNSELPQKEKHSKEETQQNTDKQVSEYDNKLQGVGDQEKTDPPSKTPPRPQSPTASKPDNSKASTFQSESADADPDQEEKDNSHSDSSTEEADKSKAAEDKNEDQCCPGDNKIKTESVSEDEESQKNK